MEFNLNDVQKQKLRDYIVLMLGAPVVKIELDKTQLDLAVDTSVDRVKEAFGELDSTKEDRCKTLLVYKGALAHAKIMLGRIRTKYKDTPVTPGLKPTDGEILLNEGREELIWWEDELMGYASDDVEEDEDDE